MKKTLAVFSLLALICTLLVTGCEPDQKEVETGGEIFPSWLVGKWANSGASFTISSTGSFICVIEEVSSAAPNSKSQISGKLNKKAQGLGPNDFIVDEMVTTGSDTDYPGNPMITLQIAPFNGFLATLTPKDDHTKFTFSTENPAAQAFFGGFGDYVKQP